MPFGQRVKTASTAEPHLHLLQHMHLQLRDGETICEYYLRIFWWSRLLGDRPSLMRLVRLMLCLLCGAKAPSMQDPGVIRWVGLKEMGILFYLCNAIYIAYVSMVR